MDKDKTLESMSEHQIKSMIALLQTLLTSKTVNDNTSTEDDNEEPAKRKKTKKTKSSNNTKQSNKLKNKHGYNLSRDNNKFLSMPEANMHKDDSRIDALLSKHPPVSRSRKFEYVNVKCRLCGKEENVSPGILTDSPSRYKCNKCSAIQG